MSGVDLAIKAKEMYPALKIVFTSGYSRDVIDEHSGLSASARLLTNPISIRIWQGTFAKRLMACCRSRRFSAPRATATPSRTSPSLMALQHVDRAVEWRVTLPTGEHIHSCRAFYVRPDCLDAPAQIENVQFTGITISVNSSDTADRSPGRSARPRRFCVTTV